jgi:hypothetical protein
LHTNDAASGIIRLIDIGVEPYLVATSVEAFIAQRLVRSICPDCKTEDKDQPEEIRTMIARDMHLKSGEEIKFFKGQGCKKCNATGFYGRTAIYEILLVNETIKELILKKVSSAAIKNAAIRNGMYTLRQDGWRKVMAGITTPGEVMKLTEAEEEEQTVSSYVQPILAPVSNAEVPPSGTERLNTSRRIYRRLNTKVNISYIVIDRKGKPAKKTAGNEQYSVTEGISAGGVQFISNEPVSLGVILELKIDLPDAGEPIVCLARVLRVELKEDEAIAKKGFYISVCFLDISSAQRVRLNKYVEEEID